MLISPTKPHGDCVSVPDDVLTFAATDLGSWLLQLNHLNTALFLHQQRLHDMSYNQLALKDGWTLLGSRQDIPDHGLPTFPDAQSTPPPDGPLALTVWSARGKTGAGQSLAGARTSTSTSMSTPTYVSPYSSLGPRPISSSSGTNGPVPPEVHDSSYWQLVSASPLPPFAPHGGNPLWEQASQGVNPALLEYRTSSLGVHTSMVPQTVFSPGGESLHGLTLPPLSARFPPTTTTTTAAAARLYASSPDGLLGTMAMDDSPSPHPPWHLAPSATTPADYEGPRCVDVSESDVSSASCTWADATTAATRDQKTISPNLLNLQPPLSPTSSSCDSLHTSFLDDDAASPSPSPCPSNPPTLVDFPSHTARSTRASRRLAHRAASTISDMSRPSTADSEGPASPRRLTRLQPRLRHTLPTSPTLAAGSSSVASPPSPPLDLGDRSAKDEFLIRHKQMGMTYKEIRRAGGFTEAESTLRGRYRTLTKSREARVRRPEWSEKDVHLLSLAVHELSPTPTPNPSRVPWKKVAEWIVAHGGSYHFGNSTCRKRWDELVRERGLVRMETLAVGGGVGQGYYYAGCGSGEGGYGRY
ncbi:hypothetical protein C8A05DRAFT_36856 [Staphylotrichum tortipilum]|uniref:Myb-like domain-containing protein n=1 Tax=Staphylotrichum tortipilum TaxID=2831512 RepID=A0AAN6MGJ8_9PEZI|nr:hypothetical protein C8A05DRAFT_36856 [Staphylotrichum longicolle]